MNIDSYADLLADHYNTDTPHWGYPPTEIRSVARLVDTFRLASASPASAHADALLKSLALHRTRLPDGLEYIGKSLRDAVLQLINEIVGHQDIIDASAVEGALDILSPDRPAITGAEALQARLDVFFLGLDHEAV